MKKYLRFVRMPAWAAERQRLLWIALASLVAVAVVVALVLESRDGGGGVEPKGFALSPEGQDVPRLTPIKVTFRRPPAERNGEALLRLDPPVEGDYVWQSERTLIFQPVFPGLLRGADYTVTVPARPEAGLFGDVKRTFTTADKLTVESVIPAPDDVEVPHNAQLLVQFSRSVAPLTQLSSQPDAQVLFFEPQLAGKGEWLNTSLYRFVPDAGAVLPNTRYEVRVPAELSTAADGVLKEDYLWAFTTFSPAIDSVVPDLNTKFVGPAQDVIVRFNQAMDRPSVESGFRLLQAGQAVGGSFAWADEDRVVTFMPAGGLETTSHYEVVLAKGLKGARGGETSTEWRSGFDTVGPPLVEWTKPADGSTGAERYGVSIKFSNPMNEDSFEGRVRISSIDSSNLRLYMSPDQLTLWASTSFKTSTRYTVSVGEGVVDRYGQPLPPFSFSFTTGARPPSVTLAIPHEIATYSASAEPVLFFHATNSKQATFTLYPLTPEEALRLQTLNHIPRQPGDYFSPSQAPYRSWTEDVSGALDEVLLRSTSLSGNGGPLPKGDYFVETAGQFRSALAFSVVDTGIVTKLSYDSLLAWTVDLDSGRPLPGVTLKISGGPLEGPDTAITDGEGLARFKLPSLLGTVPFGERRYVVTLKEDGRYGVSSSGWSQGANLYEMNIPQEYYPKTYAGHVYTDRPIYRPGEEVLYKGVVRLDDDADYSVPESLEAVFLLITDVKGVRLREEPVSVNEFGSFAASLVLADDVATGDYIISLNWRPAPQFSFQVAASSFMVAEFRKPEFEVSVTPASPAYVSGESIEAKVRASFFFGGGVDGAPVEWSASSSPYVARFPGFERYSFSDYDYYRTQVSTAPLRARESGVTDSRGEFDFSLPAVISGNEGTQQYTFGATVTDQNSQAVAGSATVIVHPASLYAGIRPAQYLARAGREAQVDVAVVDLDGEAVGGRRVTVNIYERTWVTTKEQTPDGARRYRSEPRDRLVSTVSATTDAEGKAAVSFTPATAGTIRLVAEVRDAAGRTNRAAAYLWVTGESYASWQVTNTDALKLIADKDEYRVGDVAQVLVPAPFQGATGFVTVERGKVHEAYTRSFPSNSETIEVPVGDSGVPDVFVGVILYRAPTAEDPVPRYKVGYVQLKVSTETRVLNVSIRPDREQAKPGETVRYDIQATDSRGRGVRSELSVSVVDKAILSLTEERGPNGLRAFWFERGLGVITGSSLAVSVNRSNDVISEAAAGGKGGGGLSDERIRQDFRNSAYWEAQLVTDENGRASVEVVMPDNLTTWRMQVRAISGDILVGEGTSELLSTQPLLLRPALPRFLRVGDDLMVRLLVRNATRDDTSVTVSLEAEGIDLTDGTERVVEVAAGSSSLVEWPASVSAEGAARLTFAAHSSTGLSDGIVQELPVYLDVTPETMATGGVVKTRPVEEVVYLPPYAILDKGSLAVSVQGSLTKHMSGELGQFAPTRWEGPVAKAGRVVSTLAVMRADPGASLPFSKESLGSDVSALVSAQRADGGWAWCSTCETDPQVTAWVLIALGQWRHEGNSIGNQVLDRAAGYVQGYINRLTDVERPADVSEKAYLLYALSVAGRADANLSTMRALFQQSRARLSNAGRAYLVLAMAEAGLTKKDRDVSVLLNDLAAEVIPSANGNQWEGLGAPGSTHSSSRTTGVVLRALTRVDPGHALIEETVRWLDIALRTNVCRTMVERAEAILSLSEFAAEVGELQANYDYGVELDGKAVLSGRLRAGPENGAATKVSLADLGVGSSIVGLQRDFGEKGRMYYTLDLRYVTPAAEIEALNRGIAISHEYSLLDEPGQRIDRARLGDVVRVKVTVVAPADRHYVIVDDFLPAGLEAIDPKLKTTDPRIRAQLEEERRKAARAPNLGYYAPWFRWYYTPWQQVDLRDDRVVLSAQVLPRGVHEFVYYARATTPGDFYTAPAHVEESFFPEVFGRSDSSRFVIEP